MQVARSQWLAAVTTSTCARWASKAPNLSRGCSSSCASPKGDVPVPVVDGSGQDLQAKRFSHGLKTFNRGTDIINGSSLPLLCLIQHNLIVAMKERRVNFFSLLLLCCEQSLRLLQGHDGLTVAQSTIACIVPAASSYASDIERRWILPLPPKMLLYWTDSPYAADSL